MIALWFRYYMSFIKLNWQERLLGAGTVAGAANIEGKMVLGGEMTSFCSDSILSSKKATQ